MGLSTNLSDFRLFSMLSLYLQGSTTITTRLLCGPPNLLISYCRLTLMEWLALEQLRLVRIEIYQQGKVIWQSDTVTLRDLGQGCSATSLHSRGCLAARALKGTHELDFPPPRLITRRYCFC
jgi:hypothetical protein